MADLVRVLRVTEYVGPRNLIEDQLARSKHNGTHYFRHGQIVMRVATIGDFPEILTQGDKP